MEESRKEIIKRLSEKSTIKYKAYDNTLHVFDEVKSLIHEISNDLKESVSSLEIKIPVEVKEKGKFETEIRAAADLVMLNMHTNIFKLPDNHFARQNSYVKENPMRAYCGVINIYNFLADSFKYNRNKDVGYLIGRIFINHENHFFVEGRKQLGFLFNNFGNQIITKELIGKIIHTAILYSIDLDLISPPLDQVNAVSVFEMNEINSAISLKTGKKLGFRFQNTKEKID